MWVIQAHVYWLLDSAYTVHNLYNNDRRIHSPALRGLLACTSVSFVVSLR